MHLFHISPSHGSNVIRELIDRFFWRTNFILSLLSERVLLHVDYSPEHDNLDRLIGTMVRLLKYGRPRSDDVCVVALMVLRARLVLYLFLPNDGRCRR